MQKLVFFLSLAGLFIGCQKRPSAKEIIEQSIQAHGFSLQKKPLSYTKTTQLFFPDGQLEKTLEQRHHITWKPFTYSIRENSPKGVILTQYQKEGYSRSINGVKLTDESIASKAKEAINTAYFVFWQPAKLNDPKAVKKYLGQREIQKNLIAEAVEVFYPESPSSDRWIFYFDPITKLNVGYSVEHKGRWSLILNDAFYLEHQPILIKERRSFFIDSVANTQILRAAYRYDLDQ
ncbi:MAG: DUF6503 family protein [Flavobacteriaceae bacterium]